MFSPLTSSRTVSLTAGRYLPSALHGSDHLGRPGEVMRLGWIGGQVWSWRYPTFDCLWFQVTVNDDSSLRDAGGYGIDPRCDAPSDRRR